ncbi:MAG: NAD(P)/FAD-dependent oxidoreductase [Planctomycetes bacterium]|nr:NAD(P)/FAD-dependent oxidoreductase [Planctomycetota bacterium]
MKYDVVIIGAGLSGIAAGTRLAMYGKKVCILEAHGVPGGLNSYYRRGTRNFDVGLHAFTNYVPKGVKGEPLTKLLRQLRFKHDEFDLREQWSSMIQFPSCSLCFTNDFEKFRSDVHFEFPEEKDNFDALARHIDECNEIDLMAPKFSARMKVESFIKDPLLRDMLFCPTMYYGNPQEDDMDWPLFIMVWKCLFTSGLARPAISMKMFIKKLMDKYVSAGGEILYGKPVTKLVASNGKIDRVMTADGDEFEAEQVMSSAGLVETMRLCSDQKEDAYAEQVGKISAIEYVICLDRMPKDLGLDKTIIFYSNTDKFTFRRPEGVVDFTSGIICAPNNYGDGDIMEEGQVRISHLSSFPAWKKLLGAEKPSEASNEGIEFYQTMKHEIESRCLDDARVHMPEVGEHITFADLFTPLTVKRYTNHAEGSLYGSPEKHRDGRTQYGNLFIIGADQGFHGIIGSMLSGISMANMHCLLENT